MKGNSKGESNLDVLQYRKPAPQGAPSPEAILSELILLAGDKTAPDNPDGERDKDINSFRAFQLAGQLLGPLLQWAINHETGKIIEGHKSYVGLAPHRMEKLFTDTMQRNNAANSSKNELVGRAYKGDDPVINRKLVASILQLLSISVKFKSGVMVSRALEALESGQVLPEVMPVKNQRHGPAYELDCAKLGAIWHVEFLHGTGIFKYKAIEIVSSAFGVNTDVIPQWQKLSAKLMPELDQAYIVDSIEAARLSGRIINAIQDRSKRDSLPLIEHRRLNLDDPMTCEWATNFASRYSDKELALLAKRFKTLKDHRRVSLGETARRKAKRAAKNAKQTTP